MTDRPSPTAALTAFLFATVGLVVFQALLLQLSFLRGAWAYVASSVSQAAFFGLPALVYYGRNRPLLPALRLRRIDLLCALLIILAAFVGVFAMNWISIYWMMFLQSLGLSTQTGSETVPRTVEQLRWVLVSLALAPALFEEILFRGFLLPSMEPLGQRKAVLISGALFALLHGTLEALPVHLLLGFLLAILALRTGSLFAPMLYHVVYNGIIMSLAFLIEQAAPSAESSLPALSEAITSLPMVVALCCIWALLAYCAVRRGEKTQTNPLPAAARKSLPRAAIVLLVVCFVLMLLWEGLALIPMLPASAP